MNRLDEPPGTRAAAAMTTLANQRVSGILKIDGDPAGVVYFDQGEITFAQASSTPGLGTRLRHTLVLPEESRELLADADQPDRDIGSMLVLGNYLARDELSSILRSVIVDAVIALTIPPGKGSFVSDMRLAVPGSHWAGLFTRLRAAEVQAQARSWAARVARHQLGPAVPVELRDLSRPTAVLTRQAWAVACTISHGMSAQEVAWRCGLALCDVTEQLGALIEAGLCAPAVPPAAGPPAAGPPAGRPADRAGQLAQWFGQPTPGPVPLPVPLSAPEPQTRVPQIPEPQMRVPQTREPKPREPWAREPEPMASTQARGAGAFAARRTPQPPGPLRPVMSAEVTALAGEPPASSAYVPTSPDLLRRVLDGLQGIG